MPEIRAVLRPSTLIHVSIIGVGPMGPKPVKGVDYFTEQEIAEIIAEASHGTTYVFEQMLSSAFWTIKHNLNKFPSVTIVDSAGDKVVGDINYVSNTEVHLRFSAAFSGKAYLN